MTRHVLQLTLALSQIKELQMYSSRPVVDSRQNLQQTTYIRFSGRTLTVVELRSAGSHRISPSTCGRKPLAIVVRWYTGFYRLDVFPLTVSKHWRKHKAPTDTSLRQRNRRGVAPFVQLSDAIIISAVTEHYIKRFVITDNDEPHASTCQCHVDLMRVTYESHVGRAPAGRRSWINLVFWQWTNCTENNVIPFISCHTIKYCRRLLT